MTEQKLTASTVEQYRQVFIQARECLAAHGKSQHNAETRLAATIAMRLEDYILDPLEALRALAENREREQA